MMMRSSARPPLARSPVRLRPRKSLQPASTPAVHSSPGSSMKYQMAEHFCEAENSDMRPEYQIMSSELMALAKIVHQEQGIRDSKRHGDRFGGEPLFERGRLYEEYAARRNERLLLKRKKRAIEGIYEKKPGYDLGVRVESAKKRETSKLNSQRKPSLAVVTTPMAERRNPAAAAAAATPRYSLRSSMRKENMKPVMLSVDRSLGGMRKSRII